MKQKSFGLGVRLLIVVAPILYKVLMWVVSVTSKKTYVNFDSFWRKLREGENVISAVWHQDAVISPFCYRGKRIVTMASQSKDGEVVARILERCGFIPFRGSSSAGGKEALHQIADYLKEHRGVMVGISVDGPRGPAFVFKPGLLQLSRLTGAPIYGLRSWAKRYVSMKSWDRTMIPLPFNHLVFFCSDPVKIPPGVTGEEFEAMRLQLEKMLLDLKSRSESFFDRNQ